MNLFSIRSRNFYFKKIITPLKYITDIETSEMMVFPSTVKDMRSRIKKDVKTSMSTYLIFFSFETKKLNPLAYLEIIFHNFICELNSYVRGLKD